MSDYVMPGDKPDSIKADALSRRERSFIAMLMTGARAYWVDLQERPNIRAAIAWAEHLISPDLCEPPSALNAAERRDAERKLLEKMADWMETVHIGEYEAACIDDEDRQFLLAEYAALQTEAPE